jgi:phage terminase large subunit
VYIPRGPAAELQTNHATEIVISGPAGTGKSRACLEKMHVYAQQYPRFRGLIVRKTRESLSETGLFTYEQYVLGRDHPMIIDGKPKRRIRQVYQYPNGAEIVIGGMDKPSKIMSTEYDIIFVQEATEVEEQDWQALLTRLRNHALPFQQMMADCNPSAPTHWLYQRCMSGRATLLNSRHEDNPRLYQNGEWTEEGKEYLAILDSLTGAEYHRLRLGQWVQSSGLVYDVWSDDNVSEDAEYQPGAGEVYWGVDDGYSGQIDPRTGLYTADSHPRAFVLAQLRSNGRLCVFAEHLTVKTLSDNHLQQVMALGYPMPAYAAVDSSASELKRRILDTGVPVKSKPISVEESIKETRRWLAPDTNNWRRILVHPRCKHLRNEMISYVRNPATGTPYKKDDHCLDALRYLTHALRYEV